MKTIMPDEGLKDLEPFGKLHFYKMLKSADEASTDESSIKFNYFNIVSKLKPELETRLITEGIDYLEDKLERLIFPYGHQNSPICIYHAFDPPQPDKNEPDEYHFAKESSLSTRIFLKSKIFNESETFQKIKEDLKLNKEVRKKVHSLLNLERLENHIRLIIEEIKNSDLRNYADTHETELFQGGVIFKVYRGKEQIDRLRTESAALEFFQKELPDLRIPRVYCHGKLGDFYVLLEEKIEGLTADEHFKKIKNGEKKKVILKGIIESLVNIHIKGKGLSSTYGKADEQGYLEWLKNSFVVRVSNKSEYNANGLELVLNHYKPIARLLANYKTQVFNKDANLRNWIITNSHDSRFCYAIDFENTSIAPPQLDLVSILEDKNLRLNKSEKEEFKKYYTDKFNSIETEPIRIESYEAFNKAYNAAIVHMNLVYTGFSSEKYGGSNKRKCKHLQLKSLTSALNAIRWLLKNEVNQEEKKDYSILYHLISYFKKEVQKS